MDKTYDILLLLNNHKKITQRAISSKLGISVGTVNALITYMSTNNLIHIQKENGKYDYFLTENGEEELKKFMMAKKSNEDLIKETSEILVKTAVVLAAGKPIDIEEPVGVLRLEDTLVLERTIKTLIENGIEKIYLVTGYQTEKLRETFTDNQLVFFENSDYLESGTMKSLATLKEEINEDFLLVEGDLVYEKRIIEEVIHSSDVNVIACASLSGSGDEAFVEVDYTNNLVNISKDIRQLNSLSFEMIGISKISNKLFKEMLLKYKTNQNNWLNYEYLISQLSSAYEIKCLFFNNIKWIDLDSNDNYKTAINYIFPSIKRREKNEQLNYVKEKLVEILVVPETSISNVVYAGGMTNTNYKAVVNGKELFIRIPGKCTDIMINRQNESLNAKIANAIGINVDTIYCNPSTGIKITKSIEEAETLSPRTARLVNNRVIIANIIRNLHQADISFPNNFDVWQELDKYEKLVIQSNGKFYEGYTEMKADLIKINDILINQIGLEEKPCHNDLVAENFVRNSKTNEFFLLDWEYSGNNDPMWDIAAFINENELNENESKQFMKEYYLRRPTDVEMNKMIIFKIFQDILWSVWTIAKEINGEDFGSYGLDRYNRGLKNMEELLHEYAKK